VTAKRQPSKWLLRGLVYSIGFFIFATVVLGALQAAYPNYGRDPNVNYSPFGYLSPFGQWAIISFLFILLAAALAGADALRHSVTLGRTRWARAFTILLVVSLVSPLLVVFNIYTRLPPLVSGQLEVVISIISALGFLLLALFALVYAHLPAPAPRAARQP
jgi:uncharacterized BrkB/YihY/UPF0761 family membrane protein